MVPDKQQQETVSDGILKMTNSTIDLLQSLMSTMTNKLNSTTRIVIIKYLSFENSKRTHTFDY